MANEYFERLAEELERVAKAVSYAVGRPLVIVPGGIDKKGLVTVVAESLRQGKMLSLPEISSELQKRFGYAPKRRSGTAGVVSALYEFRKRIRAWYEEHPGHRPQISMTAHGRLEFSEPHWSEYFEMMAQELERVVRALPALPASIPGGVDRNGLITLIAEGLRRGKMLPFRELCSELQGRFGYVPRKSPPARVQYALEGLIKRIRAWYEEHPDHWPKISITSHGYVQLIEPECDERHQTTG